MGRGMHRVGNANSKHPPVNLAMSPVNAGADSSEDPGVHSRCSLGNGVLSVGVVRRFGELLGLAGDAVFRRVERKTTTIGPGNG